MSTHHNGRTASRPPYPDPDPVDKWWEPEDETHGASGVGSRAARHAKKPKDRRPGKIALVLLLGLVAVIIVSLLIYQDFRRGMTAGDPNVSVERDNIPKPEKFKGVSIDSIKEMLEGNGFKVDPLVITTDSQLVAYETADTKINGVEAGILAFADRDATANWVQINDDLNGIAVVGETWAISLDSSKSDDGPSHRLADKIAAKIHADAQYR